MPLISSALQRNPLAKFRTYSYHHIMALCNSLEKAEVLVGTLDKIQGTYDVANTPETIASRGYHILLDGTIHARYFIDDITWTSVFQPCCDVSGKVGANSTQTQGEMTIIEPMGFKLMNDIVDTCYAFGRDYNNVVVVIKTIFVGHPDDGSYGDRIEDIKPLIVTLTGMSAIIDEKGTTYKINFVALQNGLGQLPQFQMMGQGIPLVLGGTVDSAVRAYIDRVNYAYVKHVEAVVGQMQANEAAATAIAEQEIYKATMDPKITEAELKSIEESALKKIGDRDYLKEGCFAGVEFILEHNDYTDPKYITGSNIPVGAQTAPGQYTVPSGNISINHALIGIIESSKEVLEEVVQPGTKKYIPKVDSTVDIDQKGNMKVKISIRRYEMTVYPYDNAGKSAEAADQEIIDSSDVFHYQYIFSGLNTDIITLDMSFKNAFSFFQTMLSNASDRITGPGVSLAEQGVVAVGGGGSVISGFTPKHPNATCNNPLFFGGQSRNASERSTTNPSLATSARGMMEKFAAIDNLHIKMEIYGNSRLLDETLNMETGAPLKTRPLYVKVDFYYPNEWLPASLQSPDYKANPDMSKTDHARYATLFWYRGLYRIFQIEHKFRQGKFTQNVELIAVAVPHGEGALYSQDMEKKAPGRPIAGPVGAPTQGLTPAQAATEARSSATASPPGPGSKLPLTTAQQEQRRKEAYDFFISKGYTPAQAAGIVGNIQIESSWKSETYNLDPKNRAQNIGYCQWQGDRLEGPNGIRQFAASRGMDMFAPQTQLEFIDWELKNSERGAGRELAACTTPEQAATVFDHKYERSARTSTNQRVAAARDAAARYGGSS